MKLFSLNAAALAAFIFSSQIVCAQDKVTKVETYKDIIEKSYNLSLQKDRQQALNILASALQKEARQQAILELNKTISEIAYVFFSDKAQQLFESGVALRKLDPGQAQDKFLEAFRLEPDNFSIVTELSRVYMIKGDCKAAQELVQKHSKWLAADEELRLTLAQSFVCQQKWQEYQKIFDPAAVKKSSFQKFWLALEVERSLAGKNVAKAQEYLGILKKIDDRNPENSYWTWRISLLAKKPQLEEGQKYVLACKNISAKHYRQYMIDPLFCRRTVESANEYKGNNEVPE